MVLHEDGNRCNSSSSNNNNSNSGGRRTRGRGRAGTSGGGCGRSSKRAKQAKIPQRGPSVAELERIIHDRQHKNHNPAPFISSAGLINPPPPAASDRDFAFGAWAPAGDPASISSSDLFGGGGDAFIAPPQVAAPRGALDAGGAAGVGVFDPLAAASGGGFGLLRLPPQSGHAATPIPSWWHLSCGQRQPPIVDLPISPPSSGVSLRIEPPSNQISFSSSNYGLPPWPEEERTGGVQWPWLFPSESSPAHGSAPFRQPMLPRQEDLPSAHELEALRFEPRNWNIINPGGFQVDQSNFYTTTTNRGKNVEDGASLLSLGPAAPSSSAAMALNSRPKQVITPARTYHGPPHLCSPSSPLQGANGEAATHFTSLADAPFYEFLPTDTSQREQDSSGEGGEEGVDLNLKL